MGHMYVPIQRPTYSAMHRHSCSSSLPLLHPWKNEVYSTNRKTTDFSSFNACIIIRKEINAHGLAFQSSLCDLSPLRHRSSGSLQDECMTYPRQHLLPPSICSASLLAAYQSVTTLHSHPHWGPRCHCVQCRAPRTGLVHAGEWTCVVLRHVLDNSREPDGGSLTWDPACHRIWEREREREDTRSRILRSFIVILYFFAVFGIYHVPYFCFISIVVLLPPLKICPYCKQQPSQAKPSWEFCPGGLRTLRQRPQSIQ